MPSWPEMNPSSARALVWASFVLVFIGPIATSRAANFMLPLFAVVLSLLPAAFGRDRTRLLASIVLIVSLVVAAIKYPGYNAEMERWRAHAGRDAPNSERQNQP